MNTRLHRIITTAAISLTVTTGVLATAGLASAAAVPCSARTLTTPFTSVGDANQYFPVDGGTFESATTSWVLGASAARNTSYQNPAKINGASNAAGLKISKGGAPKTGDVCLYTNEASMRFYYKAPGTAGSNLTVTVNSTYNGKVSTNTWSMNGTTGGWMLSPIITIPIIPGTTTSQTVTITFAAAGDDWAIDDVMIDPIKAK